MWSSSSSERANCLLLCSTLCVCVCVYVLASPLYGHAMYTRTHPHAHTLAASLFLSHMSVSSSCLAHCKSLVAKLLSARTRVCLSFLTHRTAYVRSQTSPKLITKKRECVLPLTGIFPLVSTTAL